MEWLSDAWVTAEHLAADICHVHGKLVDDPRLDALERPEMLIAAAATRRAHRATTSAMAVCF